jgi:alkylation response protein AidB-like acyl-CoA dehydrogenase
MIHTDDEEIGLIRDSAAAVAPPGGDLRRIRALRFTRPGFDPAIWATMGELGWPGLLVPEASGGAGLGMQAFCALVEQLGAGLVPEPLVEVATAALIHPGLLAAGKIVLPAWQERANTLGPGETTVLRGDRLTGKKLFIPMAAGAAAFLVVTPGGNALVAADAPGVTLTLAGTQDGGHFGTLTLEDAPAERVGGDAAAALEAATLATAASLLGVMERAFALTLDYLKTRQQFGRAIGSFQALQHRAVDLQVQIALTRASIAAAARLLDADAGLAARRAAVSRAKARASEAAMLVTREAVQLHGAIGYTDEYDVGLFLRRAMVLANLYGGAALHRARHAATEPETDDG